MTMMMFFVKAFFHVMSRGRVYFDPQLQLKPCCRAYFWEKRFTTDSNGEVNGVTISLFVNLIPMQL